MRRDARNSHHLATISHDGRFWDAYLEIDDGSAHAGPPRGRIAFSAAGEPAAEPVRTAPIFIEDSPQELLLRARELKTHQLVGLLRSALPDPDSTASAPAPEPSE